MNDIIFSLHSWPRAIVHIDGDAFFTSCEEVIHPELKGKPLITGGERGIVACASYPAKKMGISRGVSLHQAKNICPDLIILPSDYETYSLFSRRMFNIMRRFIEMFYNSHRLHSHLGYQSPSEFEERYWNIQEQLN